MKILDCFSLIKTIHVWLHKLVKTEANFYFNYPVCVTIIGYVIKITNQLFATNNNFINEDKIKIKINTF